MSYHSHLHFDEFIKYMHIDLYHLPTHPKNLGKVTAKTFLRMKSNFKCAFVVHLSGLKEN